MANSVWIIACLLISIQISDTTPHAVMERSFSSSSGPGVAPQTCGTDNMNFYCPYDSIDRCKPRNQRCTGSNICNNPDTMKEDDCSETSNPGQYYVFLGHANLFDSFGKKRSTNLDPEHQFITFRGFTYEFGESYGVQVLDISDAIYKYINGKGLNSDGIERIGSSYCSWEDANMVVEKWKSAEYDLFTKNCQDFAAAMSRVLIHGPCNRIAASRGKRQDSNTELSQYIDQQLRNCSLVCCYDDSSAAALIHNSYSLVILVFTTMTNLAIFFV